MSEFIIIQSIKAIDGIANDGVNYGRVAAGMLYNMTFRKFVRCIVFGLMYESKITYECLVGRGNLISYNFNPEKRKDFEHIYNLAKGAADFDVLKFQNRLSIFLFPHRLIRFIQLAFRGGRNGYFGVHYFAYLALRVRYEALSLAVDEVVPLEKYRILCTFCDSYIDENLLAQKANSRGVKTVTLQHGQYKKNYIGWENSDDEAYLNFVSDYILAWNEPTRQAFVSSGVHSERVVLAGLPKSSKCSGLTSKNTDLVYVSILLNGDSHYEYNLPMLKEVVSFCEKINMKFSIKPHPTSRRHDHAKYFRHPLFISNVEHSSAQFSTLHTSGIFLDKIINDEVVFVYVGLKTTDVFDVDEYSFSNSDDLYEIFKRGVWRSPRRLEHLKEIFGYSDGGESVQKAYKNFFVNLESSISSKKNEA